ncbi:hypothetical protein [Microterricola viridarii]|uniref:SHOCT domain-containing protein n=1 Tax=Microterricola viridarii TaxID=412690 RepID=A0A1H1N5C8_9MICO|nr:hypothetical protein [Microterricola viridarii]SDR94196.1 hypothetical protein SAMN04489834_0564 [Microterricola viridarii]
MALSGWHLLVILAVLLVMAAGAVGIIFLGVYLARRAAPASPAFTAEPGHAPAAQPEPAELRAARLAELEDLSARRLLSVAEYEAKRAEILDEI